MSTVFIGTSEFAAAILEHLAAAADHRPALVITRPDRPRGRGRRSAAPPVAERANELGIALAQPESVNDPDVLALIASTGRALPVSGQAAEPVDGGRLTPLRIVVCAFGALIKEPLLSQYELLNVHPSLLPRWRGAAPVERAIIAGDSETGVSIMRLTAGLDSGPVCLSAAEPIRPDDTYGSLAARLQVLGGELIVRALDERPVYAEQVAEGITYAEKIGPDDRMLDPGRPAAELERIVRALHPHVGARIALPDGTMLGVREATLARPEVEDAQSSDAAERDAPPGSPLHARDGHLLLDCTPGVLELRIVQPPGGRAMDGAAYLRGHGAPGRR